MTPAEHAAREIGAALTEHDWARLRGLLSTDFVDHSAPPGGPTGPDGYVQVLRWVTDELAITYEVEEVVATDSAVALRATAYGVHNSDAFGVPATGKSFAMPTMHWYHADGEHLTAHWAVLDQLGMLAQVGALPGAH